MAEPNRENIRAWVDALRSGEYQQGTGVLVSVLEDGSKRHCCLGVGTDLGCKAGLPLHAVHDPDGVVRFLWNDDDGDRRGMSGYLPDPVVSWLGLDNTNPLVAEIPLTILNDEGKSFAYIADLIEAEWLTPAEAGEPS